MQTVHNNTYFPSPEKVKQFIFKWTPRAIAAAVGGYYALGVAYHLGLMALIDRVAIAALRQVVGYAGIGAIMPTFQWYAAWGVRIAAAAGAGLIYDVVEKAVSRCYRGLFPHPAPVSVLIPPSFSSANR